mgnify:CR=1 FL=1
MRRLCDSEHCQFRVYGSVTKLAVTALVAGMVVLMQLAQIYDARQIPDFFASDVYLDLIFLFWIFVWILTIIINLSDRIDHMWTIVLNSVGLPGTVHAVFNAVAFF